MYRTESRRVPARPLGKTGVDNRTGAREGRGQKACRGRGKEGSQKGKETGMQKEGQKRKGGGFTDGTGPSLHHPAIEELMRTHTARGQREYRSL